MTDQQLDNEEAPAGMQDASRDEGRQYALPLVIRVERAAQPARTDALEGAAQAGHGAQLVWWRLEPSTRADWVAVDFDLAVRMAGKEQWAELLRSGLPVVTDGGFTEVAPGSATVAGDHVALRAVLGSAR